MEQCSAAERQYRDARWLALTGRHQRHLFEQLLGEHALCKIALAEAAAARRPMGILDAWVQLDRLNREWASLIADESAPDAFRRTSQRLVHGYSRLLGEWIVDPAARAPRDQDIARIADVESRFYASLDKRSMHAKDALRRSWEHYTRALVGLVGTLAREGPDAENYHWAGADCITAGRALGASLDALFTR